MRLRKLRLKNIKSYGEEAPEVEFADGVNFLSGINGAGKSTLIEAIGFALFDVCLYTQENFLRRGAKSGAVTVCIEDAGESFRVERKLGTVQSWVIYDKDDVALCEKRADVLKFLCDRFHVTDSGQLVNVFQNIVGVPQGMFTAIFKMTPKERQKVFDGIINVELYRDAADQHAGVKNTMLPKEISELNQKIAAFQTFIKEHEEDPKRLTETELRLAIVTNQITALSGRKEALEKEKEALEAIKSKIDALDLMIASLEATLLEGRKALATAKEEVDRSKEAAAVCARTKEGHQAYLIAEKDLAALEARRARRDALVKSLHLLEKEIEGDESAIKELENDLVHSGEKEQKRAEEVELLKKNGKEKDAEALTGEKEAERARESLDRKETAFEDAKKGEQDYLARIGRARSAEEQVRENLELAVSLEKVLLEFDAVSKLAGDAEKARGVEGSLKKRLTKIETSIEEQESHKKELASAICPFIREKCDRVKPAVFQEKISELQGEARKLEEALKEAGNGAIAAAAAEKRLEALRETKKQLAEARSAIRREWGKARKALTEWKPIWGKYPEFPTEAEGGIDLAAFEAYAKNLASEFDRRGREIKAESLAEKRLASAAAGKRKTADAALESVAKAEKELEDLRSDRAAKEKTLSERKAKQGRAEKKKAEVSVELKLFASFDADLTRKRGEMEGHRAAHLDYVRDERAAAELRKREEVVRRAEKEIREAEARRDKVHAERAKIAPTYDEAQLRGVAGELAQVLSQLGSAETEEKNQTKLRSDLAKFVEKLAAERAGVERAQKELERLKRFDGLLEDIWKILRDLGPRVSRRLLAGISSRANRVFGLIHDQPGQLLWGRDYEVRLKQGGHEYSFGNLSGGEQMSAALAIQMAMSRDFAQSSFCIFDEPTIHLDEARRARLAVAIREAQVSAGFTQVFLVSHDDTFGPYVDHQVKLQRHPSTGTTVIS